MASSCQEWPHADSQQRNRDLSLITARNYSLLQPHEWHKDPKLQMRREPGWYCNFGPMRLLTENSVILSLDSWPMETEIINPRCLKLLSCRGSVMHPEMANTPWLWFQLSKSSFLASNVHIETHTGHLVGTRMGFAQTILRALPSRWGLGTQYHRNKFVFFCYFMMCSRKILPVSSHSHTF